jgi:hypothetical protein
MDKTDHLMAEKNKNNKDSQKGQVTQKEYYFKKFEGKNTINKLKRILKIKSTGS